MNHIGYKKEMLSLGKCSLFISAALIGITPIAVNAAPSYYSSAKLVASNSSSTNILELSSALDNSISSIDGSFQDSILVKTTESGDVPVLSYFSYSAKAQSSDAGLKAFSSASQFAGIFPDATDAVEWDGTFYYAMAIAGFRDTLSIVGAGDLESIQVDFNIHGTRTDVNASSGFAVGSETLFHTHDYSSDTTNFDLTVTANLDVTEFGTIDLNYQIFIDTVFFPFADRTYYYGGPIQFSTIDSVEEALSTTYGSTTINDFFNTVTIGQFRGLNADGDLVDLSSATGSDGKLYDILHVTSPVPEPTSIYLLIAGLAVFGFRNTFLKSSIKEKLA